ncbi:MAG: TetR/AcrR family transcriptional regulator [Polaromonas sp.]|uniref:TetR/AcrR family transcriptional regulator n=1 Tax=Polaromonas sp. TaxID=1869339 RepID=UPI002734912F|nr:TetR/AcrR family transcriptional regulator [Polaromonas sp.]MDP2818601.1 TetR/AcrR family transcriptional regulator [Polaromonas sp.]
MCPDTVTADTNTDIASPPAAPANPYRSRLIEGMAHSVAAKGYADTTVADIVREAGVSKRSFYECFATKSDCLIALYVAASHGALKVLKESIDPRRDWKTQVEHALGAYLACLASNPALLRTLFIEILGLGDQGLQVRRRMNQELADFVVQVVHAGHLHTPQEAARNSTMAMAVVGGINELVLQAIESGRTADLAELTQPCSALVRAVLATND